MELEQILAGLAEGARQVLQADAAMVRLLDEEDARLTVGAVSGLPAASWRQEPIAVEDSSLDEEALAGQPIIIADAGADCRVVGLPEGYRSVLCVPLMHENHPVGTLHVYATAPARFGEEDVALLMPLAKL